MPPRSKVVSLPADLRAEVERRISAKGYGDYHGTAEWLRQQGYEISDDSLWRYGKGVERQLEQAQTAVYQASALASIGDTDKSVVITALKAVVEQKLLTKLTEGDPVDASDIRLMNAVANMIRASVFHQRLVDEIRARHQEPKPPQHKGLSEEAYYAIREILFGRPIGHKHSSAPAADGPMPGESESRSQAERDIEPEATASMPRVGNDTRIAGPMPGAAAEAGQNAGGDASAAMPGAAGSSATKAEAAGHNPAQPNSPQTGSREVKNWVWPTMILPGPKYQDDRPPKPKPDT
jgi:hypothetical protein